MIQKRASLDEKTVKKVAKGQHKVPKKRAPRKAKVDVKIVRPKLENMGFHPLILAELKHKKVDPSCVQFVSSECARIFNYPVPWK